MTGYLDWERINQFGDLFFRVAGVHQRALDAGGGGACSGGGDSGGGSNDPSSTAPMHQARSHLGLLRLK